MPLQNDNDDRTGAKRSGANPALDVKGLVGLVRDRFAQGTGGRRRRHVPVYAVLALVGIGAWTSYYTVPSDSVAILQHDKTQFCYPHMNLFYGPNTQISGNGVVADKPPEPAG